MLVMMLMVSDDEDACDLARGCEGSVNKNAVIKKEEWWWYDMIEYDDDDGDDDDLARGVWG